jgi:hypothetical protein
MKPSCLRRCPGLIRELFRQTHVVLATIGTFPVNDTEFTSNPVPRRSDVMRYALLWLLGVPIPVIYLLFH